MGNLTVKQIENAKPKDKPYKLMDGDGLQLRIAVDGIKTWLVRYMFDGKERQYRLPELYGDGDGRIGLKEAREQAAKMGYTETKDSPFKTKGLVFKKGNTYISPDIDGHVGGFWKVFFHGEARPRVYNKNLTQEIPR